MPVKIFIMADNVTVDAELFDTPCAKAIARELPIETVPDEWGDEFHFEIPVRKMRLDKTATTKVKVGDIGYWPEGNALAIFFGPTPISQGETPVPTSKVNIVGRIRGDASVLKKAKGTEEILVERID